MSREIIKEAERLAGGTKKLADIIGIRSQTISGWEQIPAKHVMKIEIALERQITRYQMRPDVFVVD